MPSVKIRIEKSQENLGDSNLDQKASGDEKKQIAIATAFTHQIMGIGKKIVSYASSNIGNFTGDYKLQDDINATLDLVSDGSTVALGFSAGGWIGGLVAIAGVATKRVIETINTNRNDFVLERERAVLLARSGNATNDGSRGTEN